MPTYGWVLIIAGLLLLFWLWSKYGALYTTLTNNPGAVHAGLSVARYATDIQGLVGAFESADDSQGSFTSRLGTFFGALPS